MTPDGIEKCGDSTNVSTLAQTDRGIRVETLPLSPYFLAPAQRVADRLKELCAIGTMADTKVVQLARV